VRLGGRAAELLVRGEASTGAADDLASATALATQMVSEFGLSQAIGPVSYGGAYDQPFPGPGASPGYSEQTQWLIDREVATLSGRVGTVGQPGVVGGPGIAPRACGYRNRHPHALLERAYDHLFSVSVEPAGLPSHAYPPCLIMRAQMSSRSHLQEHSIEMTNAKCIR